MIKVCFFFAVLFLSMDTGVWADQMLSLEVNQGSVSQTVYLSGISGNTTYLPVRDISEAINLPLKWDGAAGSVVWQTYQQATVITPGLDTAIIIKDEVTPVKLADKAVFDQGKVYVPIRILELLGIEVWYDTKTLRRGLMIPSNINENLYQVSEEKMNLARDLILKEKEKLPQKIGSFSTYFNLSYKSRTHNLKLAAQALDNLLIAPGQIFSFNEKVGPRTPDRGYQKAIVFVNKKQVEGYGGGVCQVSTTLYNAVLNSGLHVVERHPHSLPVPYVPTGKDATVNFGSADFKFKNNTKKTISLHAFLEKNKLTVEIFSLTTDVSGSNSCYN